MCSTCEYKTCHALVTLHTAPESFDEVIVQVFVHENISVILNIIALMRKYIYVDHKSCGLNIILKKYHIHILYPYLIGVIIVFQPLDVDTS